MSSTKISPPQPERGGLEHELHRLGDRHEIALDVGVGDGDRPARCDLPLEERHHAAAAAQHVAETDRHERAAGVLCRLLHDQLGHALGRAHHAAGIYRLVGGDEHEVLTPAAMLASTSRRVPSTLLVTASSTLSSISGTCLCAAVWKTISGRCAAKTAARRSASRMSAMTGVTLEAGSW